MALALGKTLAELEAMPHDEFVGWQAFYSLEPWGCPAEDHRAAMALDFQWAVNSKPNSEPPRWFDPDPESRAKPDPTPEQLDESIRDFFIGKTVKAETNAPADPERDLDGC